MLMHVPELALAHVGLYCPVGQEHGVLTVVAPPASARVVVADQSVGAVGARPGAGAGTPGGVLIVRTVGGARRKTTGAARAARAGVLCLCWHNAADNSQMGSFLQPNLPQ